MPPKVKITKEEIIKTAVDLVREQGDNCINARALAAALGCSTQPVFSNFTSMDELRQSVILYAYEIYLDFIKREVNGGKYPKYKAFGMAYIRFAKEEKELFKLLFMRDRTGEELSLSPDFEASIQLITDSCGISTERAKLMHLEMWSFVHGIGVMLATSFLPLDFDMVSNMTSDVYQGLRLKHVSEENQK